MKIQQVSVTNLFGIFNHTIQLNMDERITIIHSPNGFGKTAMLRMLNGFFNSQYSVFRSIPFSKFRIEFDNDSYVEIIKTEIIKNEGGLDKIQKRENISIYFYESNSLPPEVFSIMTRKSSDLDFPIGILDEIIPDLVQSSSKSWRYIPTGETLSLDEVIERFENFLPAKAKLPKEPKWLQSLKENIHIRLIESQRLLNFVPSRYSRLSSSKSSMLPTVSTYSQEIAHLIQSKLAEYGATSQSLDRTFPVRVVRQSPSSDLTDENLRDQLDDLEQIRSGLIEVGLLDKDENPDFQLQHEAIDESTKNILAVYVEDIEKKLGVFSEIANKIHLLRGIINSKFAYSYKEMNLNKEKGFIFKTLYHSPSSEQDTLSLADLSSGEQHELVLLYELLFKVEPNSLVLIDEPELSLHVGWQSQFLKDLQDIIKLVDLDVLMATHSPDIIQDRWDLTVELKGLAK